MLVAMELMCCYNKLTELGKKLTLIFSNLEYICIQYSRKMRDWGTKIKLYGRACVNGGDGHAYQRARQPQLMVL